MRYWRRDLLKWGAVGGAGLAAGCNDAPAWNYLARHLEPHPRPLTVPEELAADLPGHVLNRLGYGWRPGDRERVLDMGVDNYIEEQLAPEQVSDTACDIRANRFDTLEASAGDIFEYRRNVVERELFRHTMLRAVYSRRQLFESMVNFWTDHFNISIGKSECAWLKTVDDRAVIRAHALGNFRDLLRASALSPAMLVYLDGRNNRKTTGSEGPNENYARELLELHTLGVHGGYTQQDVMEAARCLTGWTVNDRWFRGRVEFNAREHDDGPKRVLGISIPAGQGERDLDRLLEIVVEHPSTAQYLATKLCRRFVGDRPTEELVQSVSRALVHHNFELKPALRTIFTAEEFRRSRGTRLKRPFRFVATALRALDADTDGAEPLYDWLQRLGHAPFNYPTPDGYPDEPAPWLGTLLWRWNFALELSANRIKGTRVAVPHLARRLISPQGETPPGQEVVAYLLGRRPSAGESVAVDQMLHGTGQESPTPLLAALILASPAFQRY